MPTYAPIALNQPEDVIAFSAIVPSMVQFTVDASGLLSGDILNYKASNTITGTRKINIYEDITENTLDPLVMSYSVILAAGDQIFLTLNQTAGTVKSIPCEIRVLASE